MLSRSPVSPVGTHSRCPRLSRLVSVFLSSPSFKGDQGIQGARIICFWYELKWPGLRGAAGCSVLARLGSLHNVQSSFSFCLPSSRGASDQSEPNSKINANIVFLQQYEFAFTQRNSSRSLSAGSSRFLLFVPSALVLSLRYYFYIKYPILPNVGK